MPLKALGLIIEKAMADGKMTHSTATLKGFVVEYDWTSCFKNICTLNFILCAIKHSIASTFVK